MTSENLAQDVAYARSLAEEGRHAPLLGGAYLTFWGILNAIAFSGHWAVVEGRLDGLGTAGFAYIWIGYGVIAAIGMLLLRVRGRAKPGFATIGARAERALWMGAAIAIFAVVLGSLLRLFGTQDPTAPNAIFGAAFAIYAAALFGTAELSQHLWMKRFAWLSAGVAMTLCFFANDSWAYLYAAIGSLLVLAWPGIIMLKREPAAVE